MRRLIALFLSLTMMASLAACGGSSSAKTDDTKTDTATEAKPAETKLRKLVIGWNPPAVTDVFKTASDFLEKSIANANAAGFEVELITRAATDYNSAPEQVGILENFIQQKVDCIITSPIDTDAMIPVYKQAEEAGIPVVVVNLLEEIPDSGVDSYVGFDNTVAAEISAYSMLDYYGGPGVLGTGEKVDVKPSDYLDVTWWRELYKDVDMNQFKINVGILDGVPGTFFSRTRMDGFHSVIDKCPNIKVVANLAADWERQKAVDATENMLQSNPKGQIDAIWGACQEMSMGAINAIKNLGREEVMVFSNDGTPESVNAIREGKMIAETWHGFPEWGWYGAEVAVKLAYGLPVDKIVDIRPRTEWKGNADEFYPDTKLQEVKWADILKEVEAK